MKHPRRLAVAASLLMIVSGVTACDSSKNNWQSPQVAAASPIVTSPLASAPPSPSPSPTPKPKPTTKLSAADACVTSTIAKMSLSQMAGQVMLVGTPVGTPTDIDSVLRSYDIGGIFLSGRSTESAAKLKAAISALQKAAPTNVGLLISLDQEGGEVQALQGADFPAIPTAVNQGKLSHTALAAQAKGWAKRLAGIGVTLDLAPVSDTVPASLGTKNPPIGAFYREYGSDPVKVAGDITTVVNAIQSTGVLTTLKHFPGLGRVLVNTDFSNKAVDNVTTAHDPYLGPFIAGIKAGTGAVMISSASYPKLDSTSIATFSEPIVTGLLRDKLHFTGLIVSDSLAGAAAIASVPVGQRAVQFIEAGGDFTLTTTYKKAPAMINGLIAEAHGSAAFRAKLKTAATYVVRAKYTAGLLTCSPSKA